jgi:hypothetical protein
MISAAHSTQAVQRSAAATRPAASLAVGSIRCGLWLSRHLPGSLPLPLLLWLLLLLLSARRHLTLNLYLLQACTQGCREGWR